MPEKAQLDVKIDSNFSLYFEERPEAPLSRISHPHWKALHEILSQRHRVSPLTEKRIRVNSIKTNRSVLLEEQRNNYSEKKLFCCSAVVYLAQTERPENPENHSLFLPPVSAFANVLFRNVSSPGTSLFPPFSACFLFYVGSELGS
uniref:Uncharacterized protein n=1 Tax=Tetraselmis sp. GSL018 TaxID=582737 RepID=A0A061R7L8_9CHLO